MKIFLKTIPFFLFSFIIMSCTIGDHCFAQDEEKPLRFAIVDPEIGNPQTVLASFKPLMKWMSDKVKRKIVVEIYPDPQSTIEALRNNTVDYGYTGIVDFFKIQQEFAIEPMITIEKKGEPFYTSSLIIRKEDEGKKLEDFRGQKFGYTSLHKAQGGLFPQIVLKKSGYDPDVSKFFSSVAPYFADVTAIFDLLKKSIDICAISMNTLDTLKMTSPGLLTKIHVLQKEENLMYAPFFIRTDMDPALRKKIVDEALAFAKTIEGRQLLMMFKVDGITAVTMADYQADRQRAIDLNYIKP